MSGEPLRLGWSAIFFLGLTNLGGNNARDVVFRYAKLPVVQPKHIRAGFLVPLAN